MSEDENPFENVPEEFSEASEEPEAAPEVPAVPPEIPELEELPPLAVESENKSRLAMASGFGFVFLAVVFYVGIVRTGVFQTYVFGIAGIVLPALIAFFYMLDDLRVRPVRTTERETRFVAGMLLALMVLFVFTMFSFYWPDYMQIAYFVAVMVLATLSFALFLYSMLWEE